MRRAANATHERQGSANSIDQCQFTLQQRSRATAATQLSACSSRDALCVCSHLSCDCDPDASGGAAWPAAHVSLACSCDSSRTHVRHEPPQGQS